MVAMSACGGSTVRCTAGGCASDDTTGSGASDSDESSQGSDVDPLGDSSGDPAPGDQVAGDGGPGDGDATTSVCGNGVTEQGEVCDDGHTDACGSCNATCTAAGSGATCGDGARCPELEACDDGAANSDVNAKGPTHCNGNCSGLGPHCLATWTTVPRDHATIAAAIAATPAGGTVCVEPGTYNEDLSITTDIRVFGIEGPTVTTIAGTGTSSVVNVRWTATLEGFTIRGGGGTLVDNYGPQLFGGGIYSVNGRPVFRDLVVTDNHIDATGVAGYAEGGGIECNSIPTIERVLVHGNSVIGGAGGGIALAQGGGTLRNVVIRDNSAVRDFVTPCSTCGGLGAGLYVARSDNNASTAIVENSVIAGNRSHTGAGVLFVVGTATTPARLTNVTIYGNSGKYGAGLTIFRSSGAEPTIELDGVILSGNQADTEAGGVFMEGSGPGPTVGVVYSNMYGNSPAVSSTFTWPTGTSGVIAQDPAFVDVSGADPYAWNLRLAPGSACIDSGNPAFLDPDASRADMGAYGGPGADSF